MEMVYVSPKAVVLSKQIFLIKVAQVVPKMYFYQLLRINLHENHLYLASAFSVFKWKFCNILLVLISGVEMFYS